MSRPLVFFIDNDNLITIRNLRNKATGDLLDGAAVQLTLYEEDGTTAVGSPGLWPITLTELDPAEYQGTVRYDIPITPGEYRAKIAVVGQGDERGTWIKRALGKVRA